MHYRSHEFEDEEDKLGIENEGNFGGRPGLRRGHSATHVWTERLFFTNLLPCIVSEPWMK
jgi:hypothetical protein